MTSASLRLAAVFVLVGPLVAGCASPEPPATAFSAGPTAAGYVGVIAGRVVSDLEQPLEGLTVGLIDPETRAATNATATDADGRFEITSVAEGVYEVVASGRGWHNASAITAVIEGAPMEELLLRMVPAPVDVGFAQTDARRIVMSGAAWGLASPCSGSANACGILVASCDAPESSLSEDCGARYGPDGIDPAWKTLIGEVDWIPYDDVKISVNFFQHRGLSLYYEVSAPGAPESTPTPPLESDTKRWWDVSETPSMRIQIDDAALEARGLADADRCCDWGWRLAPGWCDTGRCETGQDVGAMYDYSFWTYFSIFVNEPAPEGYTAIPPEDE